MHPFSVCFQYGWIWGTTQETHLRPFSCPLKCWVLHFSRILRQLVLHVHDIRAYCAIPYPVVLVCIFPVRDRGERAAPNTGYTILYPMGVGPKFPHSSGSGCKIPHGKVGPKPPVALGGGHLHFDSTFLLFTFWMGCMPEFVCVECISIFPHAKSAFVFVLC